MRVAFIGLGAMGAPMAANLLAAGMELTVFNRRAERAVSLVELGAVVADSPQAAVREAEFVCTCVSDPAALRAVLLGEHGAIAAARERTIFVDFSTVDPDTVREIASRCSATGCAFPEAPVSGGVAGAKSGSLTIIVGGETEIFERSMPILKAVGQNVSRVGPVGTGSVIKLVNQMLVGVNLAAVLEAVVLSQRAGVDPHLLYDIVRQSSGRSGMLERAIPGNLIPRNFEPGFTLGLLLKDLELVLAMAGSLGMDLSMATAAVQLYKDGETRGLAGLDMTSAVLALEERYGGSADAERE